MKHSPGERGKVTALVGGQWGSEGKGAIAAYMTGECGYGLAVTNAGAQAGHTFYDHDGNKKITYHLPVATALSHGAVPAYINAGAIIDLNILREEMDEHKVPYTSVTIHPRAAVITPDCVDAENYEMSKATQIASTRKGVGEALSRKVRRELKLIGRIDSGFTVQELNLNSYLNEGGSVFMEVPQGFDLSLNHGSNYPECTSRDCWVTSALSDAGVHPSFLGHVSMVVRTFPIRVGHIIQQDGRRIGHSGGHWPDQVEVDFDRIGVEAEYTTVTKRKRRVFTFSKRQYEKAVEFNRPDRVFLTFCNYCKSDDLLRVKDAIDESNDFVGIFPSIVHQWGPKSDDIRL